ncbi:MAG: EAL domain-containing protein [Microbacteriaceae bacterium]
MTAADSAGLVEGIHPAVQPAMIDSGRDHVAKWYDTRGYSRVFAILLAVFALVIVATTVVGLLSAPPSSWTFVVVVIASVVVCDSFQLHIGRSPSLPLFGVTITMLALRPAEIPHLSVGIWAIGLLVSQIIQRRSIVHSLFTVGLGTVGAFTFVAVQTSFPSGWWPLVGFVAAAIAYFTVVLTGEFVRQRGRWGIDQKFGLAAVRPTRIGLLIAITAVMAAAMTYVDRNTIPWLEQDPQLNLTPVVVLLSAALFAVLAQRSRYAGIERRLSSVVDAAVNLPWDTADGLADGLKSRAREIVQASAVRIDNAGPGQAEIGVPVNLESRLDQYLIASRKVGGAPFTREDEQALAALAHMASETARIQHDVDTLERRANTDPLTGLANYGAFQTALIGANEHRAYHSGIAVLFLDLDNFKRFNDNRGHDAGDQLLVAVAARLQAVAGGRDFISRIGGDEFVVILAELVSLAQAKEMADRILLAIGQPLTIGEQEVRPVVSAGLAFSNFRELDAKSLVVDADRSMLQVKRSRRQGGPAEGSSLIIAPHRSTRTNDMVAAAIREDRLELAFQPIVSIDQGIIWAFESLVRYVDPGLGPISPSSLVARAKGLGMMDEFTKQIITKALDAAEEFHRLEPGIACMTVNLELGQISEDQLGPFVRAAARAHPDVTLCIELNERSLRSATDDLRRESEILQDAGIIIALDDYGSDDSSVGALVRFPLDILKIDRSLVDDLTDVRQREVIKALQGFGDNLDYTMVVEGIEDPGMVGVMVDLGVRSAQGFYYGHPLSFQLTMDRLKKWGTKAVIS